MSFFGRLTYQYFYRPILSPIKNNGGFFNHFKVISGKYQMTKAAKKLQIPHFNDFNDNAVIVGVAGKNNWYQMIFCLFSFYKNLGFNLQTIIIDDGTIDHDLLREIKKQVPFVKVISHSEAHTKTTEFFDANKYPVISGVFDKFVVFKKLFHVRALIKGAVLVLDADMLFYKTPEALVQWIGRPDDPIYMYDKSSIYGNHFEKLLNELTIKPNVNTGVIGLNNDSFDFNTLEQLTSMYLKADALNYLMEQALYAMYLSGKKATCLPPEEYEILPCETKSKYPVAVMHHFPTENRQFYYRYAWRHIIS